MNCQMRFIDYLSMQSKVFLDHTMQKLSETDPVSRE